MPKERASIFDTPDIDLGAFSPKTRAEPKAPAPEEVKAVAKAANFPSRESKPGVVKIPEKRAPRIHRTGRNVQFNVKASQQTIDQIYAITEAHEGWVLGYTLERAVAALKRELEDAR
jgi:hypothetical protein